MICQALPRLRFVHLPTPLEAAPRLSESLGVNLLIKREDLAGLCVGGNKARLLEFALGSLRDRGVDTLIACAAAQSNKLRDIAAVAARCGMRAVLLIPAGRGAENAPPQGNRLLFDILGADVRVIAADLDAAAILRRRKPCATTSPERAGAPPFLTGVSNTASTQPSPMSMRPRNCIGSSRRQGPRRIRSSSRQARE